MRAKIERESDRGTSFLAHKIGQTLRQLALLRLREFTEQKIGDDEPEHVIAEKFEPLIADLVFAATDGADVGQCLGQQALILETMPDFLLERDRCFLAGAHRTSEKTRLQRTAQGHVHTSQAWVPSSIEKKIISARPTRLATRRGWWCLYAHNAAAC